MADFRDYAGIDDSFFLSHYGVGHDNGGHSGRFPWGSGDRPKQDQSYARTSIEVDRISRKKGLSDRQKKVIKTAAVLAGTALATYGAYKLYQHRDLISEGKRASSTLNPLSSAKLNTFEPTKHEHTFTSDTHKQVRGTVDRYLKALGTLGEENRPAREFIVKMAKNLDQLTDKETITNKDIAKLAEKAQNYRSLLPNTEASDLLYRDTLYDLMNLMRDRNR